MKLITVLCILFIALITGVIISIAVIVSLVPISSTNDPLSPDTNALKSVKSIEHMKDDPYKNFYKIQSTSSQLVNPKKKNMKIPPISIPKTAIKIGKDVYHLGDYNRDTNTLKIGKYYYNTKGELIDEPIIPIDKTLTRDQIETRKKYEVEREPIKGILYVNRKDDSLFSNSTDYENFKRSTDIQTDYTSTNTDPNQYTGLNSDCAIMISDGAIWKTAEDYIIDTTNTEGLSSLFIHEALGRAISSWKLVLDPSPIGSEDLTHTSDGPDFNAPDGLNEITFGPISDSSTIGLTILWGIFGGPIEQREIVEYDIIFNDVNFVFGNVDQISTVIDLQAVATHELGHGTVGFADVYTSSCSGATMYGRTSPGSKTQRTIDPDTIISARQAYGQAVVLSSDSPKNGIRKIVISFLIIVFALI